MHVREALSQISEIRLRIAQTETFRGYRSATVAFSGVLALAGAAVQKLWIPEPADHVHAYLGLWIGIAAVCVATVAAELAVRSYLARSLLARQLTMLAVGQFVPCMIGGALLTYAVAKFAPESVWLLPGVWSIMFSLGVFASWRLLPRAMFWVAVYYMGAGMVCLVLSQGDAALSPWAMAGTFGVGQLATAAILYLGLERSHGHA